MNNIEITARALNASQQKRLNVFADVLIPGGAGLPSASEVDPDGNWMERTLKVRPDLMDVLLACLAKDGEPDIILDQLKNSDPEEFDKFAFAISGAYLMNTRVRILLGYPGAATLPNPILPGEAESYLDDGILDVVINRGNIYRSIPN
jgi:hypothetical protein